MNQLWQDDGSGTGTFQYVGPETANDFDKDGEALNERAEAVYTMATPNYDGNFYSWEVGEAGPGGRVIQKGTAKTLKEAGKAVGAVLDELGPNMSGLGNEYGFSMGR